MINPTLERPVSIMGVLIAELSEDGINSMDEFLKIAESNDRKPYSITAELCLKLTDRKVYSNEKEN